MHTISSYYSKEIIVNNKPLILTNSAEKYLRRHTEAAGYLLLSGAFARNVRLAMKHLAQINTVGVIIHDMSDDALEDLLDEEFLIITAGGGLVVNADDKLLMIFRRGFWDLPKGKLDKDETIKECAIREVAEETGVAHLTLGDELDTTYHTYTEKGKNAIKKTVWYRMNTQDNKSLVPQYDEDILIARWVDRAEANLLIKQSYRIVRNLVNKHYIKA